MKKIKIEFTEPVEVRIAEALERIAGALERESR